MISAHFYRLVSTSVGLSMLIGCVVETYDVTAISEVNPLLLHCAEYDLEGMQQVLEDGDLPLLALG